MDPYPSILDRFLGHLIVLIKGVDLKDAEDIKKINDDQTLSTQKGLIRVAS